MSVPGIGWRTLPAPEILVFYAGLGAVTLLELIEWPVALLIAAGHIIHTRSRNRVVRELAEGVETAV